MDKTFIIGSGFSAFISCKILEFFDESAYRIFSLENTKKFSQNMGLSRNKNLEINKLFSEKAYSFGTLKFITNNAIIHDRLISGGNSKIWGGFYDAKNSPNEVTKILRDNQVDLIPIGINVTGSWSNCNSICQLHDSSGKIFSPNLKSENGYLVNFFVNKKKLFLNFFIPSKNKTETLEASRLILCLGTYQLIDLLFRSSFLGEGDEISLDEWSHNLRVTRTCSNMPNPDEIIAIRYTLYSALKHYLGIQFSKNIFDVSKRVPISIQQEFIRSPVSMLMHIRDLQLIGFSNKNFGSSIHYFNLKINQLPVANFLSKIDRRIICIGMPAIASHKPGPISSDLAKLAFKLLSK